MRRYLLLLPLLITGPAAAQDGPSFDCAKASTEAEKAICADPALARLDRRLAGRYAAALDTATGLDAGARAAVDELRARQRGWIKGRDECWKSADLSACIEQAMLSREGDLVAGWMLEDPAEVVTWICEGNPANEIVTFLFDTELPSIRIERGDTIDTGSLASTGADIEYQASFGRSLRIDGDAAIYREADPDGTVSHCIAVRDM